LDTPTDADWRRVGEILSKLALQHGWDARRIRDLQNDVLIALTARQYGATLVTTNRKDFEELGKIIEFQTIYV
jgi:predicted nucleic acid-binding protein